MSSSVHVLVVPVLVDAHECARRRPAAHDFRNIRDRPAAGPSTAFQTPHTDFTRGCARSPPASERLPRFRSRRLRGGVVDAARPTLMARLIPERAEAAASSAVVDVLDEEA